VLAGLGVSSLSMNVRSLHRVGAALAAVDFEQCQRAAQAALTTSDPAQARTAARAAL
jgi:phosphotransferase system enzyme I (PtsI)